MTEEELIRTARKDFDRETWAKMMQGRKAMQDNGDTLEDIITYLESYINSNT